VVIVEVVFQQSSQVPLVQNDHLVEQIATHTSDPTLGDAVLPGTAKSSSNRFCAPLFDGRDDVSRELGIAVEDQKPVWRFVPPSFAQLQYDPQAVWLTGHLAVQNLLPVVADDEEAVHNTEGQSRHGEEIHGSDGFTMVAEESQPAPGWIRIMIRTPHPARNRSFRDVESQLEQLPVDAWCSPAWILCNHAED